MSKDRTSGDFPGGQIGRASTKQEYPEVVKLTKKIKKLKDKGWYSKEVTEANKLKKKL